MLNNLSNQFGSKVKGMFGGARATKGTDGSGDMSLISGTTRGNAVAGWFWDQMPYVYGGMTELDPNATMTGSNLDAVAATAIPSELKVGGGPTQAQVPDYGGTAAY